MNHNYEQCLYEVEERLRRARHRQDVKNAVQVQRERNRK